MNERRSALEDEEIPCTPAALAAELARSSSVDASLAAWRRSVGASSTPARARAEGPDPLAEAAGAFTRDEDATAMAARVDAWVTSREGFSSLLRGRYRITIDGSEWDETRLAEELANAIVDEVDEPGRALAAGGAVADRAVDVGKVVSLSDGPARRDLVRRLEAVAPLTVGPSPYRPVKVPVTKHPQRQITLPVMGGVDVRCVVVSPSADRTLLLLHGHGERIEEHEALIDALDGAARIVAIDLPGCGYSDKPDTDYSILGYEPVIVSALDVLGISRCAVAGGGLGGNLALRLAYRYPLIVERAAAWSVAGWGETNPLLATAARAFAGAPSFLYWTVAERQLEEQLREGLPNRARLIGEALGYRREVYERAYQKAYFQIASDQVGTSMREHATAIEPPVSLLAGAADTGELNIRAAVEDLAAAMGVEPTIMEGAGYALALERPKELASHLARFFWGDGS